MDALQVIREARLAPAGDALPALAFNQTLGLDGGTIRRMPGSRGGERCDGDVDLPALIRSVYLSELARVEEGPLERHLAHWGPRLSGLDADTARATMVGEVRTSEEFARLAGNASLETLVESVYWSELGRPSDPIGHAVWLGHAQAKRGEGWNGDQIREWLVAQVRQSDEQRQRTTGGPPTDWGDVFWCYNPRLGQSFQVNHGFALVYDAPSQLRETKGRPPYELLGLPTSEERKVSGDMVQTFERGRLLWNASEGVRIELDTPKLDRFEAPKDRRLRRFVLTEPRRTKETSLRELRGDSAPARKPRLRVAPSPSGLLHPGNLWMALVNYRLAKQLGADFLLRFEDTDRASSRPEYVEAAKEALEYAGIEWKKDEVEFQSRRGELYREAAEKLIASGHAYEKNGAIWFRMPEQETIVLEDRAKGSLEVGLLDDDGMRDFVILRAGARPEDRTATFLLANTVDDIEQNITHVVRGEDHLLNAARQLCIYRALGQPPPEFFHVPHILGDEGGEKLSKRNGAASVLALKELGIAPEVLVNHLARLGTRAGRDDGRLKTLDELAETFDRFGFSKTPTRIGYEDLLERNKRYIAELDPSRLRKVLESFDPELMGSLSPAASAALVHTVRGRASTYGEAIAMGRFVLETPRYGDRSAQALLTPETKRILGTVADHLEGLRSWTLAEVRERLTELNRREQLSFPAYANALTWALTGAGEGMPLEHMLALLGKDASIARIRAVVSNQIELEPESAPPPPPQKTGPPRAKAQATGGSSAAPLKGDILRTYLRYAKHLGAPIGEMARAPSGFAYQRFTKGAVNEYGQVKLDGYASWIGSPFLLVHHLDGKGTEWLGGAPFTEPDGLRPTGNNHFTRTMGSAGDTPWGVRAIRFKLFLKSTEAQLVLQTLIGDWEHRWGFEGGSVATVKPDYPWGRVGNALNLPVGEWIDVRLDLTRDLLGASGAPFGGIAFSGDDGNVLFTDVRVESGTDGRLLESSLKYAKQLGRPVGDATVPDHIGQWTQEFERGWVRQDGQVYFRDHQHWLCFGKLDAWLQAPLALGAPINEAYQDAQGVWQQDFEHGSTNDLGWVKFNGHDHWMAGRILDAWVAHPRELGRPLAHARDDGGGLWTQSFENGWAATDGRFGIGEKAPPSPSELAKLTDDALVRAQDRGEIYVIRGGAKFHVTDPPTFERMGFDWNAVVEVEPGVLDHVLPLPRDGAILREEHGTETYEMRDGKRCPTAAPRTPPSVVPDGGLNHVPLGEPV